MTPVGVAGPVERAVEVKQLSAVLAAAAGGRGQVCVIEGPSGVGKSRLLDECAGMAAALEMNVLRARGSELTRDYPFGVVRHLFEARVDRGEAGMRAKLMRGPAALAEPVFGQGEAADEFGVLHGLYWLTVNLTDQRPTVILVDDLSWADDFSLRFLAYLAERLDDLPVALVVAIRSGDPGAESQLVSHLWDVATAPPIRPAELTANAVEELLADALPDTTSTRVSPVTWCARRGKPLPRRGRRRRASAPVTTLGSPPRIGPPSRRPPLGAARYRRR